MSAEINVFEVAARNKFRFPYKGQITVEDLWDLPLHALDEVFKTLNRQVKAAQEESLLEKKSKEDEILNMKIHIVKHIVITKQNEAAARALEKENKEQRERIMQLIAKKDEEALEGKTKEELLKELETLK